MHALVEGGADVRAVDEQGLSALLNAVKVGTLASTCAAARFQQIFPALLFSSYSGFSNVQTEAKEENKP